MATPTRGNLTPKTVMAPMAAFTMACLLFTYVRSSIKEARRNAQTEREQQRSNRYSAYGSNGK